MRIIRFLVDDGRILIGEDHGDGTATVLLDAQGILGESHHDRAVRELLRGRHALVADDDEGVRSAVGAALERVQCSCTMCQDGDEALAALEHDDVDMVVSDIVMPGHDGYQVFAAAKKRDRSLPVVLITGFGYDPGHAVVRASNEGLDGVLYKPFSPQQLIEKLADAMQGTHNGALGSFIRTSERLRIGLVLAPLIPAEIICTGRNYGETTSADLELFLKPRSSLQDPGKPIRLPVPTPDDPGVFCEGELAVVIGCTASNVSEEEARACVLGFTLANDVTARRWQQADAPSLWMRGKGFDTFCPVGPRIVTPEDIDDSNALTIITRLNGEIVRTGSTSSMHRSIWMLISEISRCITLHAGTLVLTGTPPARLTDRALRAGDEVEVDIHEIGVLRNPVADA